MFELNLTILFIRGRFLCKGRHTFNFPLNNIKIKQQSLQMNCITYVFMNANKNIHDYSQGIARYWTKKWGSTIRSSNIYENQLINIRLETTFHINIENYIFFFCGNEFALQIVVYLEPINIFIYEKHKVVSIFLNKCAQFLDVIVEIIKDYKCILKATLRIQRPKTQGPN